MDEFKNIAKVVGCLEIVLAFLYGMSACVPIVHSRHTVVFRNCTKDTLFVGASLYDNIDSVNSMLFPDYTRYDDLDTIIVFQHKYLNVHPTSFVLPDSLCSCNLNYLFNEQGICYFFLIKWQDAMNHSWNEICKKKLYHRLVVSKDKDGKFDTNIKY